VLPLLIAYRKALDSVLDYMWKTVTWRKVKIRGKQARPFPRYRKEGRIREIAAEQIPRGLVVRGALGRLGAEDGVLRNGELEEELQQGGRRRRLATGRLFARAPHNACKLEGEELRVTLEPGRFAWFDVPRRYFPLPGEMSSRGIGQPVITPSRIHIPVHAPPAPHSLIPPLDRRPFRGYTRRPRRTAR